MSKPVGRGLVLALAVVISLHVLAGPSPAWGPHPDITRAALDVLPGRERISQWVGAAEFGNLCAHCWMPDEAGEERRDYYIDDYLLVRGMPKPVGHIWPEVLEAVEPQFRRSLLALRTQTPLNAWRHLGPLVHYVEDLGAPPHTYRMPQHGPLENWVNAKAISIRGYQPRLLGKTDEEALAGLLGRLEELRRFSATRAERAMPLTLMGEVKKPEVEPILLESANESARALADVLHTMLTLGLAPQKAGAELEGQVAAAGLARNNDKGARIVLLDAARYEKLSPQEIARGNFASAASEFGTLAETLAGAGKDAPRWQGTFRLHHLAPGRYRVLAVRTGSQWAVSDVVELAPGKPARVSLDLPPAQPAGNLLQSPRPAFRYLSGDLGDRWRSSKAKPPATATYWTGPRSRLYGAGTFECGAAVKDPQAKVTFYFTHPTPKGAHYPPPPDKLILPAGQVKPLTFETKDHVAVYAVVETRLPLEQAVENLWVVRK